MPIGNRGTPLLDEHAQQCDGTVAQRNRLAAAEQCVRLCIKAERTEDVRCAFSESLRSVRGCEKKISCQSYGLHDCAVSPYVRTTITRAIVRRVGVKCVGMTRSIVASALVRCRPVLFQDRFLRQPNGFTDQKFWLRRGMLAAIARGLPSAKGISPWGRGASLDATYSRWPRAAGRSETANDQSP
jgi:hypothetical protein